jgi:cobalt-zinc-cadmium efflux system protein
MHKHNDNNHSHHHKTDRGINGNNLLMATFLNITISAIQVAGGVFSNSLALLSDALHNFGDAIAVFLSYIANRVSSRSVNHKRTFGLKRIEIFAAMINGLMMLFICGYLFYEAIIRIEHPQPIKGVLMVMVASVGLLANIIAVLLLKDDSKKNLNVKSAYLHLLSDTLSSVAVIIGGILIYYYRVYWLDPIITIIISIYIFKETFGILKQAYLILLQATPQNLDLHEVKTRLENLSEIDNVHHVHAWNLNDQEIHFECHVDLKTDLHISQTEALLFKIKLILSEQFKVNHTTVQFEYNTCEDKSVFY